MRFVGGPYPKSRGIALAATFAALISVTSPLSLSMGPVPVTLQVFFVYLAAALLGPYYGGLSMGIYLLLGAGGVPVFAGFSSGTSTLFGGTGGYLFGFLVASVVGGMVARRKSATRRKDTLRVTMSAAISLAIVYIFGVAWLSAFIGLSGAIVYGFLPFIGPDIVKAIVAIPISVRLRWSNQQLPVNSAVAPPAP
jgi:biotin transport system substrate-specific component